ncbi:MAG TPA: hypothetical protein VN931_12160, partial [Fibrobacteria bacterium]|nr:hypothetical protein [Fibrobacteria bacterium]
MRPRFEQSPNLQAENFDAGGDVKARVQNGGLAFFVADVIQQKLMVGFMVGFTSSSPQEPHKY